MHSRTALTALAVAGLLVATGTVAATGHPAAPHRTAAAPRTLDLRYSVSGYDRVTFDRRLPRLPKGAYLITYSVALSGATGTATDPMRGEAYLVQGPGGAPSKQTLYTADESGLSSAADQYLSFSGSGVVDTRQYPDVTLEVELNNGETRGVSWSTIPSEPIQVTITRSRPTSATPTPELAHRSGLIQVISGNFAKSVSDETTGMLCSHATAASCASDTSGPTIW